MVAISLMMAATAAVLGQEATQPSSGDSTVPRDTASGADSDTAIQRGEYLVYHMAMCIQCHSPRNQDGSLDRQRLLTGAPMPLKSPYPSQQWAFRAPSLKGLPGGWSQQQLALFLQTGKTPTGYAVRPPMPPFRMTQRDAEGVAAYLQSLEK